MGLHDPHPRSVFWGKDTGIIDKDTPKFENALLMEKAHRTKYQRKQLAKAVVRLSKAGRNQKSARTGRLSTI